MHKRILGFVITWLIFLCITVPFFYWFWGNFTLFGEQGFRIEWAREGAINWGIPAAFLGSVFVSAVRMIFRCIKKILTFWNKSED